jgi:hypothetical protein
LALLLFGIYMLTFDGLLYSTDGLSMITVAENIIKHGNFDTRQVEDWENVQLGADGKPYSKYPPGPTLLMLPFVGLALVWPQLGLIQTTLILMPLATALTGAYLYLSARRLGYPPQVGLAATLLTGLATMAWPRTRDLVADPLMLLSFTAAFYYAMAYRQERQGWQAGLMGLALVLTMLHKVSNLVTLPLFCWYLAAPDIDLPHLRIKRIDWFGLMIAAAAGAISLLLIGGYNLIRFANPWETGYEAGYTTPFWLGLAGLLISPYKSLFLYIPLFVLIPFCLKEAWSQYRREAALILTLLLSQLLVFAPWYDWGGGGAWGPRFLAPLNGLLVLLLLPFINRAFQPHQWGHRISLIVLATISLFMQLLGIWARDNVYLGAANYWTPPPEPSLWGELSWQKPEQWPIWGHWLLFDPTSIPVIWRWQWGDLTHFDWLTLLSALLIIALGWGGLIIFYRRRQAAWLGVVGAWLVSLAAVLFILARNYDDPRFIEKALETRRLWPAYHRLMAQLPSLVGPTDAVIFTDRRLAFYDFNQDKSAAQRYLIAKPNQSLMLETVPKLLRQSAERGRIWLVTDDLDNLSLAYATELWLQERARPTESYVFDDRLRLTAFEVSPSASWEAIPPEPRLDGLVEPEDYTFNGIAALLGWNWRGLDPSSQPILQAGQTYDLELYWIYEGKAPEDLFFIRLLDDAGQGVAQAFTTPRPSSRLVRGQLLGEDTTLALPDRLAPGHYHLQIGLLTPAVDAGELIFPLPAEITEVEVK